MRKIVFALSLVFIMCCALPVLSQSQQPDPKAAPQAPVDNPVQTTSEEQTRRLDEAIKPYVKKARDTYPDAKKRFLAGLPPHYSFYVTTRLRDEQGRIEQVFIAVTEIKNGVIKGTIASEILGVSGYHEGDSYSFPESELLDWTITRPDGSEEGNFVGKFLDTYQP